MSANMGEVYIRGRKRRGLISDDELCEKSSCYDSSQTWKGMQHDSESSDSQVPFSIFLFLFPLHEQRHRSSGVIGCLKKTQNWCLPAVGEEHQRFAGAKARTMTLHA
ncbi:hypothetical protein C5167_040342 [Papaver somniferum]|uniref:Uncharacterized protein n=1 Tax=Papaver somniferum TaxID=3469 RepID=A0A4Y7IER7_PAPSO|nr:hypothetical protein C5167_040342 [Papaver somniferum]